MLVASSAISSKISSTAGLGGGSIGACRPPLEAQRNPETTETSAVRTEGYYYTKIDQNAIILNIKNIYSPQTTR